MSKKIIILVTIILGLILLLLIGYYFISPVTTDPSGKPTGFRSFFPFGGSGGEVDTTTPTNTDGEPISTSTQPTNFLKKLRKLSAVPVAGAGITDVKAGSVVRHIETATGHIYETELFSPNQNRISNTTIPMAYTAVWANSNKSLIAQYLEDDNQTVDTYSLTLKSVSTSTTDTISGILFPRGIVAVDTFKDSVFYLKQSSIGTTGYISDISNTKIRQIWDSPLRELLAQYVNTGTVALTSKPEESLSGYVYFVNTTTGQVKKVLGDVPGLSTLVNPDATQILALSLSGRAQLFVYTLAGDSRTTITPTTFPEKCVWSKKNKTILYCAVPTETISGGSLISWYKGLATFSDQIWKYDLKNNISSLVENFSVDTSESIDVIKPMISDSDQYLVFINKKDGSLWSVDLSK